MAYQLVTAQVRLKALDAAWSEKDLSQVTLNVIYTTYAKVYVTLTNPALDHTVYLDLAKVRDLAPPSMASPTLSAWLTSLGNKTLPTQNDPPDTKLFEVGYTDASYAGYRIMPTDHTRNPQSQVPASDLPDLLLSKEGVDFSSLWEYCLVSVNGFLHRVGGATAGLYVKDGNRSARIRNDNQLGLLSFLKVGKVKTIPITPEMVYKATPEQEFKHHAHIALPESVEGKTVLLVLGGYLHVLDSTYKLIGARSIQVDFNNYPLPERVFESLGAIDLSSLGLTPGRHNNEHFALDDLYSDRAIRAYLSLSQSFVAVVDTPSFYVKRYALEKLKVPGRFVGTSLKRLPLISGLGRIYDYFIEPEYSQYVYLTEPALDVDYNFRSYGWEKGLSVDSTRYSSAPWRLARGELLEMGRYSD